MHPMTDKQNGSLRIRAHRKCGMYLAQQFNGSGFNRRGMQVKQYAVVYVENGKVLSSAPVVHVTRDQYPANIDGMWRLEAADYPSILELGIKWGTVSRSLRKKQKDAPQRIHVRRYQGKVASQLS